jgi:ribonuclease P protein component
MTHPWRVRDRASFAALRRNGVRRRVGPLTVTRLAPERGGSAVPAVAYAIARPVGSAVTRNRLRRRLQAIVAEQSLAPGTYLLSPGPEASTLAHQDLRALVEAGLA